jgi:large subunit ribosomal protein L3
MAGIIGRKVGMTRIFDEVGNQVPVTVIEAGPCPVTYVRTEKDDGYAAVQLGFGVQKAKRAPRAETGHVTKAGLSVAPRVLREFRLGPDQAVEVGQSLTVEQFEPGDRVKVTGTNKGKGFQGVVRRHGFTGRPASHGHSMSRNPGSIGPGTDPSRVIKGKKLPGRMGGVRHTVLNLQVVQVDPERNLIFVKGGVPGARDSFVFITR